MIKKLNLKNKILKMSSQEIDETGFKDEGWVYDEKDPNKRYWGSIGSGLFVTDGSRIIVPVNKETKMPMDPLNSAKKEFMEETGRTVPSGSIIGEVKYEDKNSSINNGQYFTYYTFVYKISPEDMDKLGEEFGEVYEDFKRNNPRKAFKSSQRTRVVSKEEFQKLSLHYGMEAVKNDLLSHVTENIKDASITSTKLVKLAKKLKSLGYREAAKKIKSLL
jgi:hypothetical protein